MCRSAILEVAAGIIERGKLFGRVTFPAVRGFVASFMVRERADPPSDRWNAGTNIAVGPDNRDRSDAKRLVQVCGFALPATPVFCLCFALAAVTVIRERIRTFVMHPGFPRFIASGKYLSVESSARFHLIFSLSPF